MAYIYKITNNINGKIYIGQTVQTLKARWAKHRWHVKHNTNRHLYDSMRYYGIENFSMEVLEETTKEELNDKEIWWIAKFESTNRDIGYNLTEGGMSGTRTPELIERIAAKRRGIPLTPEHKAAIGKGNKGIVKPVSDSTKIKIADTLKRKYSSGELVACLPPLKYGPDNHRFGTHHTKETKEKLSKARKGKSFEELFGSEVAKQHMTRMSSRFLGDNNPNFIDIPRNELEILVINLSLDQLAIKYNCTRTTIHNKLKSFFGKTWTQLRKEHNENTSINSKNQQSLGYSEL